MAAGQDLGTIIAGMDGGFAAAEAETGVTCRLIADIDRAFGATATEELTEQLAALRRGSAPGSDRVIGIGVDSTELGIDPLSVTRADGTAREAGFRLTAHQGENSPASAITSCLDGLGVERVDHAISALDDPELVARLAGSGSRSPCARTRTS